MLRDLAPVASGTVRRDGCRIAWQEFGSGEATVLLLPTWSIVHSDFWRHQVPVLAERYRVLTFDGLGNGASDRPTDAELYADLSVAEDAVHVMDAAGAERAAVIGVSAGGAWALAATSLHPSRVSAAVFIAPHVLLAPPHPVRAAAGAAFDEVLSAHDDWSKWNRYYWLEHYEDFLRFFFSQCFTEPDSEGEIEHFVSMGLETTPEVLLATGGTPDNGLTAEATRSLALAVDRPSLVLHGDGDAITPLDRGRALARLSGSEMVVLPGSGHEPQCRNPDVVNDLILEFLDRTLAGAS